MGSEAGVGFQILVNASFDQNNLVKIRRTRQRAQFVHVCPEPDIHLKLVLTGPDRLPYSDFPIRNGQRRFAGPAENRDGMPGSLAPS